MKCANSTYIKPQGEMTSAERVSTLPLADVHLRRCTRAGAVRSRERCDGSSS